VVTDRSVTDLETTALEALDSLTGGPGYMPYDLWVQDRMKLQHPAVAAVRELARQASGNATLAQHNYDACVAAEADRDRLQAEWQREAERDAIVFARYRDLLAEAVDALTETLQHPDHVSDEVRKERNRHAIALIERARAALDRHTQEQRAFFGGGTIRRLATPAPTEGGDVT
jgi:hypothetical protein